MSKFNALEFINKVDGMLSGLAGLNRNQHMDLMTGMQQLREIVRKGENGEIGTVSTQLSAVLQKIDDNKDTKKGNIVKDVREGYLDIDLGDTPSDDILSSATGLWTAESLEERAKGCNYTPLKARVTTVIEYLEDLAKSE